MLGKLDQAFLWGIAKNASRNEGVPDRRIFELRRNIIVFDGFEIFHPPAKELRELL